MIKNDVGDMLAIGSCYQTETLKGINDENIVIFRRLLLHFEIKYNM